MPKLPSRFSTVVLAFFQSGMMVLLVSGVVTAINRGGLGPGYPAAWMRAFFMAWPVAFTGALLSRPIAVYLTGRLTERS